ncbi:MAG: MSMEG_4193 family putative phosphomutase [Micromonosporaceae bacterium]
MLLRHGRTSTNVEGVLAGWSDVELDEVGAEQAEAAAGRLAGVPLKAVVSSPLRRCQQTAYAVAARQPELTVTTEERLGECRYGDWQGRKLSELSGDPLWPVVQYHPSAAVFPGTGAEPLAATAARAVAAIREFDAVVSAEHGPDAVWLACSHGDVIKAIVADALGLHLDQFQRIVVDPCAVTVIRYTPLRPFLVRLNDTGGDLAGLFAVPGSVSDSSDAAVGGGAGTRAV